MKNLEFKSITCQIPAKTLREKREHYVPVPGKNAKTGSVNRIKPRLLKGYRRNEV